MIITLEGASAVGKTSTSRALVKHLRADTIPEVNALFERPPAAHSNWYLEQQVERWRIAEHRDLNHDLVVLDGDVFQPFWYNWTFGFEGFQSLEELVAFYRPWIEDGTLEFPARYIVLLASETELRRRKEMDATRSRRNFESHLRLVGCQRAFFGAMQNMAPDLVSFVEASSIESTVAEIEDQVRTHPGNPGGPRDSLALFDSLVEWLRSNQPTD